MAIALLGLNKSIKEATNPGLSMAVFRSQAILTYLLSIFIFASPFSSWKLIGIILVICGVFIVTSKEHSGVPSSPIPTNQWLIYALIAAVSVSFKDIFTKLSLNRDQNVTVFLFYTLLISFIISVAYQYITSRNLKLRSGPKDDPTKKYFLYRPIRSITATIYLSYRLFYQISP